MEEEVLFQKQLLNHLDLSQLTLGWGSHAQFTVVAADQLAEAFHYGRHAAARCGQGVQGCAQAGARGRGSTNFP